MTWSIVATGILHSLLLLIGGLFFVGFLIETLDALIKDSERETIRTKVIDFWFRTADLALLDRLKVVLRSRYSRMRAIRWRYLKLFLIIPAALFIGVAISVSLAPVEEIIGTNIIAVQTNLDFRSNIIFRGGSC